MLIQLPDDAVLVGYVKTSPFHFEQVFKSAKSKFTGTEKEFLAKGLAYVYVQIDRYSRRVISP